MYVSQRGENETILRNIAKEDVCGNQGHRASVWSISPKLIMVNKKVFPIFYKL